jgi:hypothetical protein
MANLKEGEHYAYVSVPCEFPVTPVGNGKREVSIGGKVVLTTDVVVYKSDKGFIALNYASVSRKINVKKGNNHYKSEGVALAVRYLGEGMEVLSIGDERQTTKGSVWAFSDTSFVVFSTAKAVEVIKPHSIWE